MFVKGLHLNSSLTENALQGFCKLYQERERWAVCSEQGNFIRLPMVIPYFNTSLTIARSTWNIALPYQIGRLRKSMLEHRIAYQCWNIGILCCNINVVTLMFEHRGYSVQELHFTMAGQQLQRAEVPNDIKYLVTFVNFEVLVKLYTYRPAEKVNTFVYSLIYTNIGML